MSEQFEESLNTAYDDAFRTMMQKCDDLVLPMLNYMFGEHYTEDDKIIRSANEEYTQREGGGITKRITDSQILILSKGKTKKYHVECESSIKTGAVLVRIFEYGAQIALDDAEFNEEEMKLTVHFPRAGILFLRSDVKIRNTMTIEIRTAEGTSCTYSVPVMKESNFTLDQIFDKQLFFLLPFYLFQYRDKLPELNTNEVLLKALLEEYEGIAQRLEALVESGRLSSRSRYVIIQMTKRVSDKLAVDHERVKQKVGDLMGGHVINLDIFQAEDAAEARGAEKLANLLKLLLPGSAEYNEALNGTDEERRALYKKYNIK